MSSNIRDVRKSLLRKGCENDFLPILLNDRCEDFFLGDILRALSGDVLSLQA